MPKRRTQTVRESPGEDCPGEPFEISVRQPKCLIIFRRLANLAAGNDNVEIVENENTEMFYVKIKPQLVNDPVQGFGDRAVLGLFQMQ